MARKKRRVLRPGENSYARNVAGDKVGDWSMAQVEETTEEPCEGCEAKITQVYCLVKNDEFDERRVCHACAMKLVDDPKSLTAVAERLKVVGSVETSDARFDSLWEHSAWTRTTTAGNRCRTVGGIYIIIFQHKKGERSGHWGYKVGSEWSARHFFTRDLAQMAAHRKARTYFRGLQVQAVRDAQQEGKTEKLWENGTPYGSPRTDDDVAAQRAALEASPYGSPRTDDDVATRRAALVASLAAARDRQARENREERQERVRAARSTRYGGPLNRQGPRNRRGPRL